jgi:tetratricopeptide (TPR) repeat protein
MLILARAAAWGFAGLRTHSSPIESISDSGPRNHLPVVCCAQFHGVPESCLKRGLFMRTRAIVLILVFASALSAQNLEKTQKKELETQVKTMTAEAQKLESAGQLAEARIKYAESQALIEMKDVTDAIKRLDGEIEKRAKDSLSATRKLYEAKKYKEAAAALEESVKLQAYQSVLTYDLALCYFQLGERGKALEYLGKAKASTGDPKQRQKLLELLTHFTTGEDAISLNDKDKIRVTQANHLSENIGVEAYLEDAGGNDEPLTDDDHSATQPAPQSAAKTNAPATTRSNTSASHRSSLCNALADLKTTLAGSAAATFNLANCAETNGRTAEAILLLEKYLQMAPGALDADDVRVRIADLKSLQTVPGAAGTEIRKLYASVYTALAERKYDRAMADLKRANEVAPDFALTKWKLGLLYEAMGDVDLAKENFTRYQQLASEKSAKDEAALHLSTIDAKQKKYDEEIDAAGDIVSDLFNRKMNLTFNESKDRSALRAKRAVVSKKEKNIAKGRVGGFAVPFPYAQQQLSRAGEHLQIALALFPLGAEANELMALVFLQANDGGAATKSFDVVASQGLPVSFYTELRTRKQDRAVKCELNRDGIRFIYLSSYDKNGNPTAPVTAAGGDGLGDLTVEPDATRQKTFDSLNLTPGDIQKVETSNGMLKLKLSKEDIYLAPIYLPSFTPIEGPQARRFANNYTRLFVRYPGMEEAKLGTEGMSGGEKFRMGFEIANAGVGIAMGGFTGIGAIGSAQEAISIARTIHSAMNSLSVSFATWERSVDDQQRLLSGKSFKAIPTQTASLIFTQDVK